MIAMISYDGTCCIGLNVDPDVISDLEVFETCLREDSTKYSTCVRRSGRP